MIPSKFGPLSLAWLAILLLASGWSSSLAVGQQIAVTTPFNSASDSFYENHGVSFGFSLPGGRGPGSRVVGYGPGGFISPNLNFRQGGGSSAIPPFGGFDPNAGARFGYSVLGRGGGGYSLGFQMGKGSTRSNVSTAPSLVVQNGFGGSITNGAFVPFVTGVAPVVGGGNFIRPLDNAVTRAMESGQLDLTKPLYPEKVELKPRSYSNPESTAQAGDLSVSAIKQARASAMAKKAERLDSLVRKAEQFIQEGNYKEARQTYRAAIRLCEDDRRKRQLRDKLTELRGR